MVGRPERELPDDGTPLVRLASDLRGLRRSAGSPGSRDMAQRAHRSPTTLSDAAGGERLPTWDTVAAYVAACGGEPGAWRERWEAAQRSSAAAAEVAPAPTAPAAPAAPGAKAGAARPRWRWPAVAVLCTSAGLVAGYLVGAAAEDGAPASAAAPAAPTVAVRDGSDPQDTGCSRLPGVVQLDTAEVDQGGVPVGVAQLKYSPRCGAVWPRFEPFPGAAIPDGTVVHVDVVRPGLPGADGGAGTDQRFAFSAPYVGAPTFGNQAVSTSACAYAAVRLEAPGGATVESRTHCFRGATFVR